MIDPSTLTKLYYTIGEVADMFDVNTSLIRFWEKEFGFVQPKKNSEQVDQIISFAKKFLGTPYRYAGTTPSGFDCSGFISYVFGNFGFNLIHSSYGMAELGETVKLADIQPGDLLFFKGSNINSTQVGHVAMVTEVRPDAILFIHSATGGVMINNFKTSKYYISRFIKAKRLDYGQER